MPIVPINQVGQVGLVRDLKPHELPLNAWSAMQNMRARGRFMESFLGQEQVLGTPSVAPYTVLYTPDGSTNLWVYAGLSAIYGTDGTTHTNLSRTTPAYGATAEDNWTGGLLGDVAILNNGIDVPQFWLPKGAMDTDFADLTNWPASTTCKAMRSFKQYLIALDVTKSNVRYPHMIKWSHPADPRTVPASWNEADPTKDAGEYTLADTPGFVLDCLPLRDINVVYKEDSVWGMQWVGGIWIFRFYKIFDFGLRVRRALTTIPKGRHFFWTGDDLVVHDGQNDSSVLTNRDRTWLNNNTNLQYQNRFFCTTNWKYNEAWFCFVFGNPAGGYEFPNLAAVFNYEENTLTFRDLPSVSYIAECPIVTSASGDTWAGDSAAWSTDQTPWGDRSFSGAFKKLLLVSPSNVKLYAADRGTTWAGTTFSSSLERTGMGIPLKAGAPPDLTQTKILKEVWPRITGPSGSVVNIYITAQRYVDEPVVWTGPFPFVIGQQRKINPLRSGKMFGIRYEVPNGDFTWQLHGHEFNIEPGGNY